MSRTICIPIPGTPTAVDPGRTGGKMQKGLAGGTTDRLVTG